MKSNSVFNYKGWMIRATDEELDLVDQIYADCEEHYDQGGDVVVECWTPLEILASFKSVEEAREYCRLKVEQATNCRWGEDEDPETERLRRAAEWEQD